MNILFVCTGNTCRSPMAAAYLAAKIPKIKAQSRGLATDGSPVSRNSLNVMKEIGIDISGHISVQITFDDINRADKIICLSPLHKLTLLNAGVEQNKIFILGNGIPDPYGGNTDIYRVCRDEICSEIDKLIEKGFFDDINISVADKSNINDIAFLEKECFSEPWSQKTILENMNTGTVFFIASVNGAFAGYIGVKPVLDEGYIANIAVKDIYRKKGVGQRLIDKLFEYSQNKNLSFVTLEVRVSNKAAISLYGKNGFKTEGKRPGFYSNPKEDAYIMTKRFKIQDENTGD